MGFAGLILFGFSMLSFIVPLYIAWRIMVALESIAKDVKSVSNSRESEL